MNTVTENPCAFSQVDVAAGLEKFDGDRQLYIQVMKEFLRNYATTSERLLALSQSEEDVFELVRVAHNMKGLAGNLEAPLLQASALDLETRLTSGDVLGAFELKKLLAHFCGLLEATVAELKVVVGTNEKPQSRPDLYIQQRVAFHKLYALVEDYDIRALDYLESVLEVWENSASCDSGMLHRLMALLRTFAYDDALALLDQLAKDANFTAR